MIQSAVSSLYEVVVEQDTVSVYLLAMAGKCCRGIATSTSST